MIGRIGFLAMFSYRVLGGLRNRAKVSAKVEYRGLDNSMIGAYCSVVPGDHNGTAFYSGLLVGDGGGCF